VKELPTQLDLDVGADSDLEEEIGGSEQEVGYEKDILEEGKEDCSLEDMELRIHLGDTLLEDIAEQEDNDGGTMAGGCTDCSLGYANHMAEVPF